MKRIFFLSAMLAISTAALACEICGCGNNNFQIGMLPYFSKGFVSSRYTYSQYHSQMKSDPTQFSRDYFSSYELWGGAQIKKWQFMAFIPYIQSSKVSDDGATYSSGIGDMSLLANRLLFGKTQLSKNEKRTFRNEVWVGAGIKLPTGKSTVDLSNLNIGDFNSQPGTGSFDYLLNVTHNLSVGNSGLVTNVTYRLNSGNQQGFKYGNRVYINSIYFHSLTYTSLKVRPNIGLNFQASSVNQFAGQEIEGSSSYILNGVAGVNLVNGKWGLMIQGFAPIAQDMYQGQTNLQWKGVVGLSYSF